MVIHSQDWCMEVGYDCILVGYLTGCAVAEDVKEDLLFFGKSPYSLSLKAILLNWSLAASDLTLKADIYSSTPLSAMPIRPQSPLKDKICSCCLIPP